MKQKYKTLNHEKFKIRYHIIFSTKYRRKCLNEIRIDLLNSMKRAESLQNKWKIEIMEIDKDHIHFLISATPTNCIYKIIHSLKQISTYDMWKLHHDWLSKFYWKKHHLWTRGYFCTTIGEVSEEKIKHYIENQG